MPRPPLGLPVAPPPPLWGGEAEHATPAREDLQVIREYMEAWATRQEAILQDAVDRMAVLCAPRGGGGGDVLGRGPAGAPVSAELKQAVADALAPSGKALGTEAAGRTSFRLVRQLEAPAEDDEIALDIGDAAKMALSEGAGDSVVGEASDAPKRAERWGDIKSLSTATLPKAQRRWQVPRDEWSGSRFWMAAHVESTIFDAACGFLIFANAITIAYTTDMSLQEAIGGDPGQLDAVTKIEAAFIVFYFAELSARIFVYRLGFFISKDWAWNSLDVFLVVLAVYDLIMSFGGFVGGSTNFSFMRLLKVLKVMKTLRTVRVLRMFRELRLMIESVFGSLKSLIWALLMIAMVTYIFGCIFTQAMALHLTDLGAEGGADGGADGGKAVAEIMYYWSTVLRSMNTLYMCSTSGESWRYPSDHLYNFSGFVYVLFVVYISFFSFVVVNSLTSIIIEATMHHATHERSEVIAEELKRKRSYISQFEQLFKKLDDDHSGDISLDELEKHLNDEGMLAFMQSLDIDASDISQFFSLLALDGSNAVDVESFVVGCMKLKGTARSMDLLCLYNSHVNLSRAHRRFEQKVSEDMGRLQESTQAVLRILLSTFMQGDADEVPHLLPPEP